MILKTVVVADVALPIIPAQSGNVDLTLDMRDNLRESIHGQVFRQAA